MSDDAIKPYLDEQGRVTRWPTRKKKGDQKIILEYLISKFDESRHYNEREVNDLLNQYHTFEDWAMLRRELFEKGYLNREKDGSRYWRTAQTKIY